MRTMIVFAVLITSLSLPAASEEPEAGITSSYYQVRGTKVDAGTFTGWRMYHDTCVLCHGADGVGSERGPDLLASVRRLTPEEFRIRVLHRYLIDVPAEEMGTEAGGGVRELFLEAVRREQEQEDMPGLDMPVWEHNPVVRERIMFIYGYLKARADGVLAPGHPGVIK